MDFIPYEPMDIIFRGEPFGYAVFMLAHALDKIGGNASIKRSCRLAGENINLAGHGNAKRWGELIALHPFHAESKSGSRSSPG